MIRDPTPRSQHQTSPLPPFSLLYPPTSRPAGVRFDRPRPPFFSPPLTPPQRLEGGKDRSPGSLRARPGAPESQTHPRRKGSHPLAPAATEPAQMLQTLTCIDAMMEPSPQGRRGQRRRGRRAAVLAPRRGGPASRARGGA